MTATAEFPKEEIVQRGKKIYERDIRPLVEAGNEGRVVAIEYFELIEDEWDRFQRERTI